MGGEFQGLLSITWELIRGAELQAPRRPTDSESEFLYNPGRLG